MAGEERGCLCLLFLNNLLVALHGSAGDKLMFNMNFYSLIHSMSGNRAKCYADAARPKLS